MAHSLYIDWQTCWSVRCMFIHSETHALKGRLTAFLQSDVWHLAYVWHLYWCAWMHGAFSYRDMSIDICRTDLAHVQHPVIHQSAMGRRWSQEGQGNREMRKSGRTGRTRRTRRTTREDQAEAGQETLTAPTWNPEPPTWQMIFRKKQIIRSA